MYSSRQKLARKPTLTSIIDTVLHLYIITDIIKLITIYDYPLLRTDLDSSRPSILGNSLLTLFSGDSEKSHSSLQILRIRYETIFPANCKAARGFQEIH